MALDAVMPDLSGMLIGGAAARPDSLTGFRDEFSSAFQTMLSKAPERVRNELKINSGYRSPEVQAQLWKEALDKYGSVEKARKHVAPPGKSKHGEGVAADLHYASEATKQWVRNNAKNYGLAFPLQHEPWHMELASARKRDVVAAQPQVADITGESGNETMTGAGGEADYTAPAAIQGVYDGYQSGKMTPQQESEYIRDVMNGDMQAPGPLRVPDALWKAYSGDGMDAEQRADFEADVNAGKWDRPSNESETWIGSAWNAITGEDRAVKSTEALPDWGGMPEMNDFTKENWWNSAKTALGTMFTSPEETVKVIKSQFPGVEVRQDAPGTYILKSSIDGKEYAIKPGIRASDAPRIAGGVAAFTPAGKAATTLGGMATAAGTEAAIQTSQAATGGTADLEQIPLAALGEGGGRLASKAIGKGLSAAGKAIRGAPAAVAGEAAEAGTRATVAETVPPEGIGELVRKASKGGKGSEEAVRALAQEAKVNPAALAAAQRRGFDLPADVLIDDPMVKEAVGLTRSLRASEASVAFDQSINRAIDQADEALKQIGASPDISTVNENIKIALTKSRDALEASARKLYTQVDEAIPKQSPVDLSNLKNTLDEIAGELGGVEAMTPVEKKLLALANAEETATYGRLIREKALVGKAIGQMDSPYSSLDSATLKRVYGALAEDQLATVEALGNAQLRADLRKANQLTQARKGLETRIIGTFGKDLEGSITTKLRSAIKSASKGDVGALNRIIKAVPEDMRKEAVATALMAATRSTKAGETGFGFSQFSALYTELKANKEAFNLVMSHLGPEAKSFMADMAEISQRITVARGNIMKTGASNQALLQAMTAEGVVAKVLSTSLFRRGAQVAGGAGGAVAGGGFGAGAGVAMANVLTDIAEKTANRDALLAAGKMFASEQFKDFAEEAAINPRVSERMVKRLARSSAFRRWAKTLNNETAISKPERFILSLIQDARTRAQEDQKQ
jgi:hypothetical protein